MFSNAPRLFVSASVALALVLSLGSPIQAGYVVNITESGGNVIAVGSGTINAPSSFPFGQGSGAPYIDPAGDSALFGATVGLDTATYIVPLDSAPASFGTGPSVSPDSGSGDAVGVSPFLVNPSYQFILVPYGYTFGGSLLSSSDTWDNATFSSLGLTPGTYTWTWGSGANADFFTMNIGVSSVPEPASVMMLGTGSLAILGYARRRRRPSA